MTTRQQILICDDSIHEIRVLVSMLRSAGYRLTIAVNGRDACNRAAVLKPDLILLDVKMPVMDGLATCRILKAHRETRNIPVIFLTAANELEARLEGLRCGAIDYISKPANEDEVLLRVAAHIRKPGAATYLDEAATSQETAALVNACIGLLNDDLGWTPTADELGSKLGVGHSALTSAFREALGVTVFEWLRERRMQQACDWLLNTNVSISTIAANLGFTTSGNFSTAFGERFNKTPRTFRKESKRLIGKTL